MWRCAIALGIVPAIVAILPLEAEPQSGSRKFALLVGCTTYEHLPNHRQLTGPANDVVTFRRILHERFGFGTSDIVTLSELDGKTDSTLRPTRANIMRELERLATSAGQGDQVVVLLGGHGSQQPDQPPFDEVDGLDETFLPADAGPWDGGRGIVANAIIDDELNAWAERVTDRGARLAVICDCCHSGTLLRDTFEVAREVPPSDFQIPDKALQDARRAANERTHGRKVGDEVLFKPGRSGKRSWVALYAALPHEATVERIMPPGREPKDAKVADRCGLFSYTICQILEHADRPLTYRDLHQQIQSQYMRWDLSGPTPLIEGNDLNREVFGTKVLKERAGFQLMRGFDGTWQVNAGRLHGITTGTILAVYADAGSAADDRPLGHVRVAGEGVSSSVVVPCSPSEKFRGPEKLTPGMLCSPVQFEYSAMKVRVAVDDEAGQSASLKAQQLRAALTQAANRPDSLIELSPPHMAHWIVQLRDGAAVLRPADEAAIVRRPNNASAPPGRPGLDNLPLTAEAIGSKLERIASIRNLLELASPPIPADQPPSSAPIDVRLSLVKYRDANDRVGTPMTDYAGIVFKPGDQFDWKVKNYGRNDAYFTVLHISSDYQISAIFPSVKVVGDNRLGPGSSKKNSDVRNKSITIRGGASAREFLVLVAVAGDQPTSFSWLADSENGRRAEPKAPLERIFNIGVFGDRKARGEVTLSDARQSTVQVVGWEVKP